MERFWTTSSRARRKARSCCCGGERDTEGAKSKGFFVKPTIFSEVKPDMKIAQEEIFGPVLSAIRFEDPDEAVAIANGTIYGLVSAVWTKDIKLAHRLAGEIKAGSVWINTYNGFDTGSPFGGYKQSGFGRDLGVLRARAVHEREIGLGGAVMRCSANRPRAASRTPHPAREAGRLRYRRRAARQIHQPGEVLVGGGIRPGLLRRDLRLGHRRRALRQRASTRAGTPAIRTPPPHRPVRAFRLIPWEPGTALFLLDFVDDGRAAGDRAAPGLQRVLDAPKACGYTAHFSRPSTSSSSSAKRRKACAKRTSRT